MGWFSHDSDEAEAHRQFYDSDNKAELSHELIAGAASYEAMKAYEEHCQKEGKPESHERAKEIIAGFAGAFIDRELETRGMDFVDRERIKHNAKKRAQEGLSNAGEY